MRTLLLFIVFICFGIGAQSQQYHFVYLQTDHKQPFYVKIQEKLYSSSSTGYLVIPKLRAGNHIITVGFPKNEWPSQNIPLQITDKDVGFTLKNFETKGWGLFNWQTMEVINSNLAYTNNSSPIPANNNDGFSSILSEVVNTPLEKKAEKISAPTAEPLSVPTTSVVLEPKPVDIPRQATVAAPLPKISKLSTVSGEVGTIIFYEDRWEGGVDTIQVLVTGMVEQNQPTVAEIKQQSIKESSPKLEVDNSVLTQTPVTPKDSSGKFLDIELPNPNAANPNVVVDKNVEITISTEAAVSAANIATKPVMINSDCKQVATEEDFFKSRKKMVAQNSEQAMIAVSAKFLKQKCYTVAQLKNLSALFLTDAGKYEFFEASYPFVLDSHNFISLESLLTDTFYVSRFKSLVRK
ncbi:MAG: hypothetical protein WD135_04405 [Ferruginibacter sp.]